MKKQIIDPNQNIHNMLYILRDIRNKLIEKNEKVELVDERSKFIKEGPNKGKYLAVFSIEGNEFVKEFRIRIHGLFAKNTYYIQLADDRTNFKKWSTTIMPADKIGDILNQFREKPKTKIKELPVTYS